MGKKDDRYYMSSVKLGPKGQIVIPKEARAMFGLEPGDTLVLLADTKKGIALQTADKLDPFLGSGTTAAVAKQLGRHYIGIELNPDYCKLAEKRIGGETP